MILGEGKGLEENSKLEKKIKELDGQILEDIQKTVLNNLTGKLDKLPDNIQNTIKNLKKELLEGCDRTVILDDITIEQFIITDLGEENKKIDFVLKILDTVKSVSTVVKKDNEELVKLTISNKESRIIGKKLDNRNDENILIRQKDKKEQEGVKVESEEGIQGENFSKQVFNEIVVNTWNEIFLNNKEELDNETDEQKRKQIIDKNAQSIADLFTGVLQGTVDYTHSTFEFIKDYFIHFLEKSPILLEPPIIKDKDIKQIEDGVIVASGTYKFELDGENGERTVLPANFTFIFEKNKDGNWTIAGLHSYTD